MIHYLLKTLLLLSSLDHVCLRASLRSTYDIRELMGDFMSMLEGKIIKLHRAFGFSNELPSVSGKARVGSY